MCVSPVHINIHLAVLLLTCVSTKAGIIINNRTMTVWIYYYGYSDILPSHSILALSSNTGVGIKTEHTMILLF